MRLESFGASRTHHQTRRQRKNRQSRRSLFDLETNGPSNLKSARLVPVIHTLFSAGLLFSVFWSNTTLFVFFYS